MGDLDGRSPIGDLFKSPKLKNCDLYFGDFVIEGTKAPIHKIARMDKGYLVVDACYSQNPSLRGVSEYNPGVKCKIGLKTKGVFSKWLCHEADGRVVCNRGQCLQWEHFWSVPIAKDKVALVTWQLKYLSARRNGSVSTAGHSKAWEWFTVVRNNDGTVSFLSHHGTYLSVSEDGSVRCVSGMEKKTAFEVKMVTEAVMDEKEKEKEQKALSVPFDVERLKISLQGVHGKFVCAEPNGNALCNREHCAEWEQFVSVPIGKGVVGLQTAHGKYLSAEPNGKLVSNREWCKSWEHFQVMKTRNGKVGLRSAHGKYLSAQPNGTLQCNRDALREWEEFKVAQC